jgi:hypothetical protein
MQQNIVSIIKKLPRSTLHNRIEVLFSFIFASLLVGGNILLNNATLDIAVLSRKLLFSYALSLTVACFVIFCGLVCLRKILRSHTTKAGKKILPSYSDWDFWLITSGSIFALYIPIIFLCRSVLTPDSWNSLGQIVGDIPLSNTHPVIFTAFVAIFIKAGQLLNSLSIGLFLFSFAQSAILASIFATVITWMRREGVGKAGLVATFIFYAILPINAIAGIIMWKDILFAGFGLLLLIALRKLYVDKDVFFNKRNILIFTCISFFFCIWRSNGLYAYAAFVVITLFMHRKTMLRSKYFILLFSPLIASVIFSSFILLFSQPSSTVVMLSVPLQQIARTVKYHDNTISAVDRGIINEILPTSQLGDKYNPNLSDPVMWAFNKDSFERDRLKYIKIWFRLGVSHKKTYIAAFVYNSYGYMYPYYRSPTTTDLLMDNTIHMNAFKDYSDTAQDNGNKIMLSEYRNLLTSTVPIVNRIGFYTCIIVISGYITIIRRRRELIGVFTVLTCLLATTVLGPVNGEFRYLYLFAIATPFVLSAVLLNPKNQVKGGRRW